LIAIVFFLATGIAGGSDFAKEQRWADQIVDALLVGEAEWLPVGDRKVLALYTENMVGETQGGAIIVHGIGAHPNWPEVIQPLRSQLPEHGWATLSIQMPILPNEAEVLDYVPLFKEVPPRIEAAIRFLQDKGIRNVVIIAHSLGTAMSSWYLASQPDNPLRAYVGISMIENDKDPHLSNVAALKKIRIPVLDIYGSRDQPSVIHYAAARKQAGRHNPGYRQLVIQDADHFYEGKEDELIKRIRGWLAKVAAGTELKRQ
jgi:pimeloyl-ACP methyl ester carboxylesterase